MLGGTILASQGHVPGHVVAQVLMVMYILSGKEGDGSHRTGSLWCGSLYGAIYSKGHVRWVEETRIDPSGMSNSISQHPMLSKH